MVKIWYVDNNIIDPRLECHKNPQEFVSLEALFKKTGVEYFKWNMKTCDTDGVLDRMMKERGYNIVSETLFSRESMPDYDESLKSIFIEHLHEEEETRLFLEGSGYFDVRDDLDQWIRIAVSSGDMLVLPCGIFHRFSPDIKDYVKMRSFSKREDMWIPYERPDGKAEHMECRQTYLAKLQKGYFVAA